MGEEEAIKKDEINTILHDELSNYISVMIKELKDYINKSTEGGSNGNTDNELDELHGLNEILEQLNIFYEDTNIIDSVISSLNDDNYDFTEVLSLLDLEQGTGLREVVKEAQIVLVSQILLQVQSLWLWNSTQDNYDVFLSHCSWDAREV